MKIVLFEPEIPANTGNIARLCAATGSELHLIEPLGFRLNDRELKRAGLDYWQYLTWKKWKNWAEFIAAMDQGQRVWVVESGGMSTYAEVNIQMGDVLVFGRETKGLPEALLTRHRENWVNIPMKNSNVRSLNLANCVSIVLYHVLQRHNFSWS